MATWNDVARLALALPEATEAPTYGGARSWRVRDKVFAWERPLRRGDLAELGDAVPSGPVLAARVPDVSARDDLIADSPDVHFTTSHFAGYPTVLVRLDEISTAELAEVLEEAWRSRAPRRLVSDRDRAG